MISKHTNTSTPGFNGYAVLGRSQQGETKFRFRAHGDGPLTALF